MFNITLYQFSPAWGLPNPSPFCMKLEGYLKLGGLPYVVETCDDPRKAPKGKMPYARIDKQVMGDSEHIYQYLHANHALNLEEHLTETERAMHHALTVMCDEGLYFCVLYSRWMDDDNWPTLRDTFFARLPALLKPVISSQLRKKVQAVLHGQGMGRHNRAEVYAIGEQHLNTLSVLLGEKWWFGDVEPVKLDVVVTSYLANILQAPIQSPLRTRLKQLPNLVSLAERGLKEIYGL